jgi:predicted nucleic acid-binding protein
LIQDVVLDTDFLSAFLKIDCLQLVRDFYQIEAVQIPPAVYGEVRQARVFPKLAMLPWVRVTPPDPGIQEKLSLQQGFDDFGSGEKEAIALAQQLRGAVLLMNDNRARLWATGSGLHSLGIPAFLLACKRTLLIDSQDVRALVLDLQEKDRYRFRQDVLNLLLS